MADPNENSQTTPAPLPEGAVLIPSDASDFEDFASKNDYSILQRSAPAFASQFEQDRYEQAIAQNPELAEQYREQQAAIGAEGLDAREIAEAVAANIDSLGAGEAAGRYALNQTINTAIGVVAEADPSDPSKGQVHYVAFVQGSQPRTYVFTENITINGDGTITSQMEEGQGWDMRERSSEPDAYGELVKQFADAADPRSGRHSPIEAFEQETGEDLAVGGVKTAAGEYEVRNANGQASVASASDLNDTTALEIESSYAADGSAQISLRVIRENVYGVSAQEGVAAGVDSAAKHEAYSGMAPGINTLQP